MDLGCQLLSLEIFFSKKHWKCEADRPPVSLTCFHMGLTWVRFSVGGTGPLVEPPLLRALYLDIGRRCCARQSSRNPDCWKRWTEIDWLVITTDGGTVEWNSTKSNTVMLLPSSMVFNISTVVTAITLSSYINLAVIEHRYRYIENQSSTYRQTTTYL